MKSQFTIARLLLATSLFAMVLGISTALRGGITWVWTIPATLATAIILFAERRDLFPICYSVLSCGVGMFFCWVLQGPLMHGTVVGYYRVLVIGAIVGWLFGQLVKTPRR